MHAMIRTITLYRVKGYMIPMLSGSLQVMGEGGWTELKVFERGEVGRKKYFKERLQKDE